jgi:hypothetical protein
MGWFTKSTETPVQQFGAPSAYGATGYNGMMMQQQMDPSMGYLMQQNPQMQNPMMQQMANDPVIATAKLLSLQDPMAAFIQSNQMGVFMDLIGEIITLSLKDFFTGITFTTDDEGNLSIDSNSLPTNLISMSPENVRLTLQSLQTACLTQTESNKQQIQMLLAAHNPLLSGQQQPGFFGSLLGSMIGNQAHGMGGYGAMGAAGMALV